MLLYCKANICLSVYLPICLSACLSIHPYIYHLTVCPSIYLSTYLPIYLYVCICLSVCLYIIYPIYLSILPYSLPSLCPLIIICLDLYSLTTFCLVLIFLCGGSCWLPLVYLSMSTKQFARTGIGIS